MENPPCIDDFQLKPPSPRFPIAMFDCHFGYVQLPGGFRGYHGNHGQISPSTVMGNVPWHTVKKTTGHEAVLYHKIPSYHHFCWLISHVRSLNPYFLWSKQWKGNEIPTQKAVFFKPGGWRCNRNSWQLASLATLPTDILPWFWAWPSLRTSKGWWRWSCDRQAMTVSGFK